MQLGEMQFGEMPHTRDGLLIYNINMNFNNSNNNKFILYIYKHILLYTHIL